MKKRELHSAAQKAVKPQAVKILQHRQHHLNETHEPSPSPLPGMKSSTWITTVAINSSQSPGPTAPPFTSNLPKSALLLLVMVVVVAEGVKGRAGGASVVEGVRQHGPNLPPGPGVSISRVVRSMLARVANNSTPSPCARPLTPGLCSSAHT